MAADTKERYWWFYTAEIVAVAAFVVVLKGRTVGGMSLGTSQIHVVVGVVVVAVARFVVLDIVAA